MLIYQLMFEDDVCVVYQEVDYAPCDHTFMCVDTFDDLICNSRAKYGLKGPVERLPAGPLFREFEHIVIHRYEFVPRKKLLTKKVKVSLPCITDGVVFNPHGNICSGMRNIEIAAHYTLKSAYRLVEAVTRKELTERAKHYIVEKYNGMRTSIEVPGAMCRDFNRLVGQALKLNGNSCVWPQIHFTGFDPEAVYLQKHPRYLRAVKRWYHKWVKKYDPELFTRTVKEVQHTEGYMRCRVHMDRSPISVAIRWASDYSRLKRTNIYKKSQRLFVVREFNRMHRLCNKS